MLLRSSQTGHEGYWHSPNPTAAAQHLAFTGILPLNMEVPHSHHDCQLVCKFKRHNKNMDSNERGKGGFTVMSGVREIYLHCPAFWKKPPSASLSSLHCSYRKPKIWSSAALILSPFKQIRFLAWSNRRGSPGPSLAHRKTSGIDLLSIASFSLMAALDNWMLTTNQCLAIKEQPAPFQKLWVFGIQRITGLSGSALWLTCINGTLQNFPLKSSFPNHLYDQPWEWIIQTSSRQVQDASEFDFGGSNVLDLSRKWNWCIRNPSLFQFFVFLNFVLCRAPQLLVPSPATPCKHISSEHICIDKTLEKSNLGMVIAIIFLRSVLLKSEWVHQYSTRWKDSLCWFIFKKFLISR